MCIECYKHTDVRLDGKSSIKCHRCNGTGIYSWGSTVNGKPSKTGECFACCGKGVQDRKDLNRENTYFAHRMRIPS